jgi:uncharacterized protein
MKPKAIILLFSKSTAMEAKYQRIRKIVTKELSHSHHDIEHVERVYNLCLHLAKYEPEVDLDVLKTAALLHDVARVKEFENKKGAVEHATLGAEMADEILKRLGYEEKKLAQIKHCITVHRYRRNRKPHTVEAKILFDADKLDSLGAVGIARCFMMAGHYGQKIYSDAPIEEYLKDNVIGGKAEGPLKDVSKHSPNLEFELKFKHIPERLYTGKAKEIAKEKLGFMQGFFDRLKTEVEGDLQSRGMETCQ